MHLLFICLNCFSHIQNQVLSWIATHPASNVMILVYDSLFYLFISFECTDFPNTEQPQSSVQQLQEGQVLNINI